MITKTKLSVVIAWICAKAANKNERQHGDVHAHNGHDAANGRRRRYCQEMYGPWIEKIRKTLKSSNRMKTFIEKGRPPHDAANPLSGGRQVTIA
jgi:hypothetical protein